MSADAKFGRNCGTAWRRVEARARGFAAVVRTEQGGAAATPPGIGGGREERKVGNGKSFFTDVLITGIADDADNLVVRALAIGEEFVKRFADGIFAVEKNIDESLIDDGGAGGGVGGKEITAVDERNFHGFEPAGRDIEEIAECGRERGAIDEMELLLDQWSRRARLETETRSTPGMERS